MSICTLKLNLFEIKSNSDFPLQLERRAWLCHGALSDFVAWKIPLSSLQARAKGSYEKIPAFFFSMAIDFLVSEQTFLCSWRRLNYAVSGVGRFLSGWNDILGITLPRQRSEHGSRMERNTQIKRVNKSISFEYIKATSPPPEPRHPS